MTVVKTQSTITGQNSAVRLARYAAIIGVQECAFFGVNDGGYSGYDCRDIWMKAQRDMVAKYLAEAQEEIEQETGYPLIPRYIGQGQSDAYQDWHTYQARMVTRYGNIIAVGIEASSNVALASVVDYTSEPAVIGPIATTVTDESEIHVYHPGTDIEIDPSSVTISGGNVTIEIPRCRVTTEAANDNPEDGVDYSDLANFEVTVDVKRVYTDTTNQATIAHSTGCQCGETTSDACIRIINKRVGIIDVQRTTATTICSTCGGIAKLNYLAGMTPLTRQAEDAIVRLAHSKMPVKPCSCEVVNMLWTNDRTIPETLTAERLNCPFGLSNGAWVAWRYAESMKLYRVNVL